MWRLGLKRLTRKWVRTLYTSNPTPRVYLVSDDSKEIVDLVADRIFYYGKFSLNSIPNTNVVRNIPYHLNELGIDLIWQIFNTMFDSDREAIDFTVRILGTDRIVVEGCNDKPITEEFNDKKIGPAAKFCYNYLLSNNFSSRMLHSIYKGHFSHADWYADIYKVKEICPVFWDWPREYVNTVHGIELVKPNTSSTGQVIIPKPPLTHPNQTKFKNPTGIVYPSVLSHEPLSDYVRMGVYDIGFGGRWITGKPLKENAWFLKYYHHLDPKVYIDCHLAALHAYYESHIDQSTLDALPDREALYNILTLFHGRNTTTHYLRMAGTISVADGYFAKFILEKNFITDFPFWLFLIGNAASGVLFKDDNGNKSKVNFEGDGSLKLNPDGTSSLKGETPTYKEVEIGLKFLLNPNEL